jgi:hypothetical protein
MKPIGFEYANDTIGGEVPVNRGRGVLLSRWKANWRERLEILVFGTVWLMVKGDTQPPILLSGNRMFRVENPPEQR